MNRICLLTAGTLVLGAAAFAQTTLKVDVPFKFHVGNAELPAGHYTVIQRVEGGIATVYLRSQGAGRTFVSHTVPKDHSLRGKPQLAFLCDSGNCSLREIRTEQGVSVYPAPRPAPHATYSASTVALSLTAENSD
ncbi:MAG: hypothetical protein ABJC09_11955 [Terriglobia bacterium]